MRRSEILMRVPFPMMALAFSVLAVPLSSPALAHAPGVVLSGFGTATIAGVMSPGEWDGASSTEFAVNLPEGGTAPGSVFAMNDENNLYLAIRFARAIVDPGNSAVFEFDNDHSGGARVSGDDVLVVNPSIDFFDEVRTTEPPCPAGALCGLLDTTLGGTNDGAGAFHNDGTFTVYEFAHPLNSLDDAHDFSLTPGATVGFTLMIRMIAAGAEFPVGFGDTSFPTPCISCLNLFGDIVIASRVLQVPIDIKPDSFPNSINLKAMGTVPVAVLSTPTFDATTVNPTTVTLASAFAGFRGRSQPMASAEDVNGDGLQDLVIHFETEDLALTETDTEAILEGETFGGTRIRGIDTVRIVR